MTYANEKASNIHKGTKPDNWTNDGILPNLQGIPYSLCTNQARYYGPFRILKCIGQSSIWTRVASFVQVRPSFHASRLKELLGSVEDQLVTPQELIEVEALTFLSHELKCILGFREGQSKNQTIMEYKIKWKDCVEEDATWETWSNKKICELAEKFWCHQGVIFVLTNFLCFKKYRRV